MRKTTTELTLGKHRIMKPRLSDYCQEVGGHIPPAGFAAWNGYTRRINTRSAIKHSRVSYIFRLSAHHIVENKA
jgi:hypothetical protein